MNNGIRNLIIAPTKEQSINFLETLIFSTPEEDIEKIYKLNDGMSIKLFNGTTYKTILASTTARGNRVDRIYIHHETPQDVINDIALPMVCSSKLPIEERVIYF